MYKVRIAHKSAYSLDVTEGSQSCTVDAKAGGITPPGMLLGALGSCVGVYIRKYADGAKLPLDGFEISIEASFEKDAPMRFQEIRRTVDLKGAILDDRRKHALLEFIKNCPVHNTLNTAPNIEIALT